MKFISSRLQVATLAALLVSAAWAGAQPLGLVHHGDFQRMMKTGDLSGLVDLSALPREPGRWGLGATAELKGEIVQLDGRLLVSPGADEQGRVRPPVPGERAVLFAGAPVPVWQDVTVPRDMDAAAFEAFVQAQASRLGLPTDQPFVFRVEGRFPHLLWHVVTGGQQQDGKPGGHGGHAAHGAHPNQRSELRQFRQPGASGQLIGVYSGSALEGVVSHPGERFHLHFADATAMVSGHVDRYSVAEGSMLKLPAP